MVPVPELSSNQTSAGADIEFSRNAAIRPFKIISTVTPRDFGLAYENISFQTTDQVVIRGWFIKHPNPQAKTIIILHGYPADKGNLLPVQHCQRNEYGCDRQPRRYRR